MKTFIQLGRLGDIINLLPVLYQENKEGRRSALMVSRDYASVLEGVSYLEPIVYDGPCWEVDKACQKAKKDGLDYVCCQVAGPTSQVKEHAFQRNGFEYAATDCFQKEAWRLAGKLDLWRQQPPLVFDRRDKNRETELKDKHLPAKRKIILLSTGGHTSKFPYPQLLRCLLDLRFKRKYSVVDLADVKAERFYDLLGLYEAADVLIANDSAPLHLAYAMPHLPVVALINDKPKLWHGAAWRPNHIWHCRYEDFPIRAPGMLEAIEEYETRKQWFYGELPVKRHTVHVWSQYEPFEPEAIKSWAKLSMASAAWVECPVEVGAVGRDSKFSELKDEKRYPYVKDVIRLGTLKASADDIILLTRAWTVFDGDPFTADSGDLGFMRRAVKQANGSLEFHPQADAFWFTKQWWQEHQGDYPDMLMGMDQFWHRILMDMIRKHGGKELLFKAVKKV